VQVSSNHVARDEFLVGMTTLLANETWASAF
jgi:hypothetical protein